MPPDRRPPLMPSDELATTILTDLLARARAGDAARAELFARAQVRLERLARKMLRGYPAVARWEETGDVLQNSPLRLSRALDAVLPGTTRAFFGLAAEQVRRELIDLARHYRGPHGLGANHASGFHGPPGPAAADPAPGPGELDRWAALHEAVGRLPAEEREVFVLAFSHGWEQKPIAELFGVDERTVRRRLRSAGRLLQDAIGGELPGDDA